MDETARAKLLLVLAALIWGVSWPIIKIGLEEFGVWMFRVLGYSISAASLFAMIRLQGRDPVIPRGTARLHVVAASGFNVIGFGLFSSLALLSAATSRVVIITYSMPVWGALTAWMVLGERPDTRAWTGLMLCLGGLAVLVYPLAVAHSTGGVLLALACALSWAAGTVYMKWARIPGDLLAITAWQIVVAGIAFAILLLLLEGSPTMALPSAKAVLAVLFFGLIGNALAFVLWFAVIERLATATAVLGALLAPVVGVAGSMLMLGERPSAADLAGFALIFMAAICVLTRLRRPAEVRPP